jgi:hypothetical protein
MAAPADSEVHRSAVSPDGEDDGSADEGEELKDGSADGAPRRKPKSRADRAATCELMASGAFPTRPLPLPSRLQGLGHSNRP